MGPLTRSRLEEPGKIHIPFVPWILWVPGGVEPGGPGENRTSDDERFGVSEPSPKRNAGRI